MVTSKHHNEAGVLQLEYLRYSVYVQQLRVMVDVFWPAALAWYDTFKCGTLFPAVEFSMPCRLHLVAITGPVLGALRVKHRIRI